LRFGTDLDRPAPTLELAACTVPLPLGSRVFPGHSLSEIPGRLGNHKNIGDSCAGMSRGRLVRAAEPGQRAGVARTIWDVGMIGAASPGLNAGTFAPAIQGA
jgi:hypothetical protein